MDYKVYETYIFVCENDNPWLILKPYIMSYIFVTQFQVSASRPYGLRREKTCLRGIRESEFQTSLVSYRD